METQLAELLLMPAHGDFLAHLVMERRLAPFFQGMFDNEVLDLRLVLEMLVAPALKCTLPDDMPARHSRPVDFLAGEILPMRQRVANGENLVDSFGASLHLLNVGLVLGSRLGFESLFFRSGKLLIPDIEDFAEEIVVIILDGGSKEVRVLLSDFARSRAPNFQDILDEVLFILHPELFQLGLQGCKINSGRLSMSHDRNVIGFGWNCGVAGAAGSLEILIRMIDEVRFPSA
ncbi:hypothetical protein VTK26DRAFT_412 [Humicola hyalothermophila]